MADRIRILFLLGSLVGGGSEKQVLAILRRLNREAFQPLLYIVYRKGQLLDDVPADVPVFSYWDQHAFPRFHLPGQISLHQCRDVARLLSREKVDLICDINYQMTLLAACASRRFPIPRVSVVGSDPTQDLPASRPRFLFVKRMLLRRAYRTADRVVVVSNGVRDGLCRYYRLPPDNVVTIFNLVEFDRIDRHSGEFRPAMESDRFHVVSVGRLQTEKGHKYLVDAMSQLVHQRNRSRLLLWLVGTGPQEEELRAYVRARQLESHVRFEGFQPNPLPFVKNAHLFCLPSLLEGLPNALAEAIACRTPVLATDCYSGPREMLNDGRYGHLVPPADSRALADGIEDALTNYDQWVALTPLARDHLERYHAAEIAMAEYEALFAELLALARSRR